MGQKTTETNQFACESEHKMMAAEFTAGEVNAEIRGYVVDTIRGIRGGGSLKSRLRTAARLLGLPIVRVQEYHYDRVRRIEAHEAFQIIQRAQRAKQKNFASLQAEYLRQRAELADRTPQGLAWLVPPTWKIAELETDNVSDLDPLLDLEDGAGPTEGDRDDDF